jgi:hypothetical protein
MRKRSKYKPKPKLLFPLGYVMESAKPLVERHAQRAGVGEGGGVALQLRRDLGRATAVARVAVGSAPPDAVIAHRAEAPPVVPTAADSPVDKSGKSGGDDAFDTSDTGDAGGASE